MEKPNKKPDVVITRFNEQGKFVRQTTIYNLPKTRKGKISPKKGMEIIFRELEALKR